MRIDEALSWAVTQLSSGESPAIDARALLCHVIDKPASYLYTWPDRDLSSQQTADFQQAVARRAEGEPVAYITGSRAFWTLNLRTRPSTLIPRPETELLIEHALNAAVPADAKVLDLGTGTGAIALALASEHPDWQITGVDRVADAVELARENAILNGITSVTFLQSNWFDDIDGNFDLIVTNPPYVESHSPYLTQGDVRFEPASALTAGEDGMSDITQIVGNAVLYLKAGGFLFIEHGNLQGKAVRQTLAQHGFTSIDTFCDLNQHERVTTGVLATC